MNQQYHDTHTSELSCSHGICPDHYHEKDPIFVNGESRQRAAPLLLAQPSTSSGGQASAITVENEKVGSQKKRAGVELDFDPDDRGFRRIIRNFTPS